MKLRFLVPICIVVAAGCSSGGSDSASVISKPPASESHVAQSTRSSTPNVQQAESTPSRLVAYDGKISVSCDNFEKAVIKLNQLTNELGGYISESSQTGDPGGIRSGKWIVKVPSNHFDPFMTGVGALGNLISSSSSSADKTDGFYDDEAKLDNLRSEKDRLQHLLKTGKGRQSETEDELARVSEDMAGIEAKQLDVRKITSFSTVEVSLQGSRPFTPVAAQPFKVQASQAFNGSLGALNSLGKGIAVLLIAFLPWSWPVGLLAWIGWRIWKRTMPRSGSRPSAPTT